MATLLERKLSSGRPVPYAEWAWIQWVTAAFDQHMADYQKFDDYYSGDQELAFSTDRWRAEFGDQFEDFSDNWCQVVVDAESQRMRIIGWDSTSKEVADAAQQLWDDPKLALRREFRDTFRQSLIKGDSYVIGFENEEEDTGIEAFFNDALDVEVFYDPSNKRRIARAMKRWVDSNGIPHIRAYLPDRILSYFSQRSVTLFTPAQVAMAFTVSPDFPEALVSMGWEEEEGGEIPNPYGVVPVFHFKNRPMGTHGQSEIKSIIPVQDAINKELMDLMLASEFAGFPQKWMSGGGHPPEGWRAGAERVWATTDKDARFGQFAEADLEKWVRVLEMKVGHVAKISATPMHYLRTSGDAPSGEALKTAESGLVHKCRDAAEEWTWPSAYLMRFLIQASNLDVGAAGDDIPWAFPVWDSFETRHDLEQAQTAQLKALLGVPLSQVLKEHFGYTEEQIKEFGVENHTIISQVLQQILAQTGQLPPGLEDVGSLDIPQLLALLPKAVTAQTAAGEATTNAQANTRPPGSPTRRSSGFQD